MPRFPCSRFFRYSTYCTGSGRSRPYWCRKAATAAGSPMARCPRLAAAGSPGTRWVSTNATSVMPTHSTRPVPSRCSRKRRRSRCRPPAFFDREPGAAAAVALAELTEIDEPERVRLEVLHRVRADQDLGRLDQLVQGLPGRLVRGARGGGPHLLQRRVRTLGPARPQPDQGPGQEVQVVARVGEVRTPVPEPDLLLAAPVAVQRNLDRLALQLDRDPDLLQVLLDPGGQVAEVEPVHLDVAGVDQGQRRVAHTGGGQGSLRLGQV